MMRNRIFIVFFYFFTTLSVYSQRKDTVTKFVKEESAPKIKRTPTSYPEGYNIKINPLQLAIGEIRLTVEKKFKNHNSIELIGSYFFSSQNNFLGMIEPPNGGFKIGLSYRYYFGEKNWYLNMLGFYTYLNYSNSDITSLYGNFAFPGSEQSYDTTYALSRKMYSFEVNIGKVFMFNGFFIDTYWGIGIRYKEVNVTDEYIVTYKSVASIVTTKDNGYFYGTFPSVQLGFNIGFNTKK